MCSCSNRRLSDIAIHPLSINAININKNHEPPVNAANMTKTVGEERIIIPAKLRISTTPVRLSLLSLYV
jgi:hypothetical protein